MTVRDLEREMVGEQKWAVEVCKVREVNEDGQIEEEFCEYERHEYQLCHTAYCPYFDYTVDYIRCVGDVITICVSEVEPFTPTE